MDIKTSFRHAVRETGLIDFRFHDLRHTFVTNLRRAGVHDFVIMEITGHKTMSMFKRYNTVGSDELHNAVRILSRDDSNTHAHIINK